MERQPYRIEYSRQKKFSGKLVIIGICVVAIIIILVLWLFTPTHSKMEKIYIGKVVQIEGVANDVGLVEDFKEGKFILIKPLKAPSQGPNYYQLGGRYSIKILAASINEYERNKAEVNKSIVSEIGGEELNKEQDGIGISQADSQNNFQNIEDMTLLTSPRIDTKDIADDTRSDKTAAIKNDGIIPSILDESKKKKQAALETCETMIAGAAKKADEIDIKWEDYKAGCLNKSAMGFSEGTGSGAGTVSDRYGRTWFNVAMGMAVSSTSYIDNATLPECRILIDTIGRLFGEIRATIEEVSELARKSSILPGQIRGLREKYFLEWSGWEK